MKIDPTLVYSGASISTTSSGTVINVTTTNTVDLSGVESRLDTLSGVVSELGTKIQTLENPPPVNSNS